MFKELVWLITGTSHVVLFPCGLVECNHFHNAYRTGFGRELTFGALNRGDKVAPTASSLSKIHDLREIGADILELDVTSPLEKLQATAKHAVEIHGRIDVVVNNVGYLAVGALEEETPGETYRQFNTNVFGGLNIARAFLPYFRARKSGTVVWIGSVGGWGSVPNAGLYSATEIAIRGLSETLYTEISPLGLRSMYFEFGFFRKSSTNSTEVPTSNLLRTRPRCPTGPPAYDGKQPGDPKKLAQVTIDVVRKEGVAHDRETPLGLPLGSDCYNAIKDTLSRTANVLEQWEDVIKSTDFPGDT